LYIIWSVQNTLFSSNIIYAKFIKEKKDSQLIVRIQKKERDEFVGLCDDLDTTSARQVRRFIRAYLENKGNLDF